MLMSELEGHLPLLFGEVCLRLLLLLSTGGKVSLDSATSWIHSTVSKHSVVSQTSGSGGGEQSAHCSLSAAEEGPHSADTMQEHQET